MRRVWLPVPLAAGAGLVSLVACFGAFYAIYRFDYQLYIYHLNLEYPRYLNPPPSATLRQVMVYTVILAWASLTLPPLALGAKLGRALLTGVLCSFGFGTFVILYFSILNSGSHALNKLVLYPLALMALVGTSVVGSLVAVQGEGRMAAHILPATLIAALTLDGASLFAYWLFLYGERSNFLIFAPIEWSNLPILAPIVVAAFSWPVLPGIAASLRS